MTGLPLVPGLVLALILVVATVLATRLLARRAADPIEVHVVGNVPPVSDWLPDAVKRFATQSAGSTVEFTDLMDGPILRGHQALLTLPSDSVVFELRTQPHLVLENRPRSHPLVIIIDTVESASRTGLPRLVYGSTPSAAVLDARTRLQAGIARSARDRGLKVHAPRPMSSRAAVIAGSILIGLVLLFMAIGPITRLQPEKASAPSPTPWFPAGAVECAAATKAPKKGNGPTRVAVAKGTSCTFGQTVRGAYAKAGGTGPTLKLGKLKYDKKTKVAVTCNVGDPIVCKGGKRVVYLS